MLIDEDMPPDLAHVLGAYSPVLVIEGPVLIRYPQSPTGWLIVRPGPDTVAATTNREDIPAWASDT